MLTGLSACAPIDPVLSGRSGNGGGLGEHSVQNIVDGVAGAYIEPVSPSRTGVTFVGDFETRSTLQWSGEQSVASDRILVVSDPHIQGNYAAKFTVRSGDDPINASGERAELYLTGDDMESSGQERWYRWQTKWESDFSKTSQGWSIFAQWHHTGSYGPPPVAFQILNEQMYLAINKQGGSDAYRRFPLGTFRRGVWRQFLFHAKWSPYASTGFVEVWVDGVRVLPKTYIHTMYSNQKNYLKVGLYRSSRSLTDILWHDGWTKGTSRTAVMGY